MLLDSEAMNSITESIPKIVCELIEMFHTLVGLGRSTRLE
jgi:hypothetical protein